MLTDQEKLAHVLSELKRVTLPDVNTESEEYWNEVGVRCDNATDTICDDDDFIKNLIMYIES